MRMGQDKALLPFRSGTLLSRAVDRLQGICHPVFIASNNSNHHLPNTLRIEEPDPGHGPMGGMIAVLRQVKSNGLLVSPCDSPLLPAEAFTHLLKSIGSGNRPVVYREAGHLQPLVGWYPKSFLPELVASFSMQEYGLQQLLSKTSVTFIDANANLPWYQPGLFHNVNSPEDYQQLEDQ